MVVVVALLALDPVAQGLPVPLLQQGAAPVTGAADLLCVYGLAAPEGEKPAAPAPAAAPPAGDAAKIYALLGAQPQTLEALCEASGLAPAP